MGLAIVARTASRTLPHRSGYSKQHALVTGNRWQQLMGTDWLSLLPVLLAEVCQEAQRCEGRQMNCLLMLQQAVSGRAADAVASPVGAVIA